jgi:hypothetical protein
MPKKVMALSLVVRTVKLLIGEDSCKTSFIENMLNKKR